MAKRGWFVTFEGIDGAGKTTQIERIERRLVAAGRTVVRTREPGGTDLGDEIRAILLDPENRQMSARTEALLYAASRSQHVDEVIRPALRAGHVVLCDRFSDASIAYQGGGLELGEESVRQVNEFALAGIEPDVTLLFDLSLAESRRRLVHSRKGFSLDRIEQRDEAYFHRVQQAFYRLAERDRHRIYTVDASASLDVLEQEIWHIVWNKLK